MNRDRMLRDAPRRTAWYLALSVGLTAAAYIASRELPGLRRYLRMSRM
jgi:hypothetical protein